MNPVSLRLPDDLGERLQTLANKTGRSKTYYIVEAIKAHLTNLEDIYLAEQVRQPGRCADDKRYPFDGVTIAQLEAELDRLKKNQDLSVEDKQAKYNDC